MSNKDKEKKIPQNLIRGKGVNLLPPLTDEQVQLEERKVSINVNSAYALLLLIVFSVGIFGFNLVTKLDLNQKKENLFNTEKELSARLDVMTSNDEIMRRINLYRDIEDSTFSSKAVLDYWQDTSKNLATISSIQLTAGMNFTVTGTASSLTDVSKLWYKLGVDEKVESVDLKNVVKDADIVRFNFEGKLNFEEFAKNG